MDATIRKPFQGIINIIRFNWHFYFAALVLMVVLFVASNYITGFVGRLPFIFMLLIIVSTLASLLVSFYVYDYSGLYHFRWLSHLSIQAHAKLLNVHAGFDESSRILADKYPDADLMVFDFYDPEKHTEVSIKRARKAYRAFPGTKHVDAGNIPAEANGTDIIFLIFAVHEIRDRPGRIELLNRLSQCLNDDGKIVIVEHLRDLHNFLAYNIGFLHFFAKNEWKQNFQAAALRITGEFKVTPFISVFILEKNASTS